MDCGTEGRNLVKFIAVIHFQNAQIWYSGRCDDIYLGYSTFCISKF